jgi:predicted nuclease of predicted toxin-antitoxin system
MLLYMDVHVPFAITAGLRLRGVDVLTAQDDDTAELDDDVLLDRVTNLGRVIFTRDVDFLGHARERQRTGMTFSGVVYAHQLKASIGQCVADLELIAKAYEPEDMMDRVEYLPL